MPKNPGKGDILDIIKDMQTRLSRLERYDRDRSEFYDEETQELVIGRYIRDDQGNIVQAQRSDISGLTYPHDHTNWTVPISQSISTTDWVTIAEYEFRIINYDAIQFFAAIGASSGTTFEARVFERFDGVELDKVQGSGSGTIGCNWKHPFTVGWGSNGDNQNRSQAAFLQYQVRRVSGGSFSAFPPASLMFRSSRFIASGVLSETDFLSFS